MICYPWATHHESLGEDLNQFKHLKRWYDEMTARPGVQRGMAVGNDLASDWSQVSPEEQERRAKLLFNQRARPAPDEVKKA
jgi:GST-like protein